MARFEIVESSKFEQLTEEELDGVTGGCFIEINSGCKICS